MKKTGGQTWEALIRPSGRVKKDATIIFGDNGTRLEAKVLDEPRLNSGQRSIEFLDDKTGEKLKKTGHIPLPPYLDRPDSEIDRRLYQTVFAEKEGAVASPTAGLHFDLVLLKALEEKGVEIVYVTLHVGYGTFQPVTCEDLSQHIMEEEEFELSEAAAQKINQAVSENRRVIACGTTSVRVLESCANGAGQVSAQKSKTRLFIYPPHEFKIVRGLITNFHIPQSTLLLLVDAYLDIPSVNISVKDKLFNAYAEAIREKYRFYSYGDAMLIL